MKSAKVYIENHLKPVEGKEGMYCDHTSYIEAMMEKYAKKKVKKALAKQLEMLKVLNVKVNSLEEPKQEELQS